MMQIARSMPLGPPVWNRGFWKKLTATRNSKRKLEQEWSQEDSGTTCLSHRTVSVHLKCIWCGWISPRSLRKGGWCTQIRKNNNSLLKQDESCRGPCQCEKYPETLGLEGLEHHFVNTLEGREISDNIKITREVKHMHMLKNITLCNTKCTLNKDVKYMILEIDSTTGLKPWNWQLFNKLSKTEMMCKCVSYIFTLWECLAHCVLGVSNFLF